MRSSVHGLGHQQGLRGRGGRDLAVAGRIGALVDRVLVAEGGAGAAGAAQDGRHRGRLVGQIVLVAAQTGPGAAVVEVGGVAVGDDDRAVVAAVRVPAAVDAALLLLLRSLEVQVAGPVYRVRRLGRGWRRRQGQLERGVARVADVVERRRIDYVAARRLGLGVRDLGLDRALVRVRGLLAQG